MTPRAKAGAKALALSFVVGFSVATLWSYAAYTARLRKQKTATQLIAPKLNTNDEWLLLPSGGLPHVDDQTDLALMNLRCCPTTNKPGREIAEMLATLDEWTQRISSETVRNFHRYQSDPAGFDSEGEWRMAMMCAVLSKDLGVRYDPALSAGSLQKASDDIFFADPTKVFLQGLLGSERTGGCSSLPVLHVAIGKRLGYPMHLVAAKGHLFARWDDGKGVRVNLESSSAGGFVTHPDQHYRTWPLPISEFEELEGHYLKNLSTKECLAVFLSIRSTCHSAKGKLPEATLAASQAIYLAPNVGEFAFALRTLVNGPTSLSQQVRMPVYNLPPDPVPGLPYSTNLQHLNPHLPHQ